MSDIICTSCDIKVIQIGHLRALLRECVPHIVATCRSAAIDAGINGKNPDTSSLELLRRIREAVK